MFGLRYWRPFHNLLRIFWADRTPHQLALGAALGLLIGVLPKGNLITAMATVLLFAWRMNLGAGLTTLFLVSLVGHHLEPLTHGIGVRMLQTPVIYRFLAWAYQLPLVPWTSLNNSVVLGSLVLGCALVYPTYHISHGVAERIIQAARRWRRRPEPSGVRASLE